LPARDRDWSEFGFWQPNEKQRHSSDAFGFLPAADQPRADGADEQRDAAVEPDQIERFANLGNPAGRDEKKAAGRLAAAFGEGFFGRRDDGAFSELAEKKAGTGARGHEWRSSMRSEKSSAEAQRLSLVRKQFGAKLGR